MKINRSLNAVCADKDILARYQHYIDSGNKQGGLRLLHRIRRLQNEALHNNREKLAFLDYIIARLEKTDKLSESK